MSIEFGITIIFLLNFSNCVFKLKLIYNVFLDNKNKAEFIDSINDGDIIDIYWE